MPKIFFLVIVFQNTVMFVEQYLLMHVFSALNSIRIHALGRDDAPGCCQRDSMWLLVTSSYPTWSFEYIILRWFKYHEMRHNCGQYYLKISWQRGWFEERLFKLVTHCIHAFLSRRLFFQVHFDNFLLLYYAPRAQH